MDLMIHTIVWGIVIGILVSAPLGPIGVLVIQRSLNKGRWSGLVTGLGATVSDMIYAVATGVGMSLIVDFVEANQSVLQIVGSVVLLGFGVFLFRQNPVQNIHKQGSVSTTYWKDFVTAILLTLSNPLIIFLFIGLFARTNLLVSESTIVHYFVSYLSVAIGAFCWWFFITWGVSKVRHRFNIRSLWLINKVIGVIVIVMSIIGLIYGLNAQFNPNSEKNRAKYQLEKHNDYEKSIDHSVYSGIRRI